MQQTTTKATTKTATAMKTNKMALSKSIKMYLTIFLATTCIYMVLYQYHISRQPIPVPEIVKNKDISVAEQVVAGRQQTSLSSAAALIKRYNLFLWPPMSTQTTPVRQSQLQHNVLSPAALSPAAQMPSAGAAPPITAPLQLQSAINSLPSQVSLASSALSAATPASSSASSSTSSSTPASTSASFASSHALSTQNRNETIKLVNGIPIVHANRVHTANATATTASASATFAGSATNLTAATTASHSSLVYGVALADGETVANRTRTSAISAPIASATITSPPTTNTTSIKTAKIVLHAISKAATGAITADRNSVGDKTPVPAAAALPPLYIITPTYRRPEQLAELTRLGYTLKHVSNLLWLVIEDANRSSPLVTQTLNRIGVVYEYFLAPMPEKFKTKKFKPRGVSNRNRGLEWLRANATEGVFYFADDDNTYDVSIFEQMRYTKKVSMWPVGLVTKFGVSSPVIRKGKIDGFYDGWIGGRKYPVDMAGFAVSVKFLLERPQATMPFKPGYEEDGFLKSLAPLNNTEIELLASDCTEILTWHTQTKKNVAADAVNMTKYGDTNLVSIDKLLVRP